MDFKKLALYGALAVVAATLWNTWLKEHPRTATAIPAAIESNDFVPGSYPTTVASPKKEAGGNAIAEKPTQASTTPQALIHVKTDVLDVYINPVGGDIVKAALLKYPVSLQEKNTPVELFSNDPNTLYITQSGLTSSDRSGPVDVVFHASQQSYTLQKNAPTLSVVLSGQASNGISVTKLYTFKPGNYAVLVDYKLSNHSAQAWSGSVYSQIKQKPVEQEHGFMQPRTYEGAAISSPEKRYQKLSYKKLENNPLNVNIKQGWMAFQQHYFLSAWVPDPQQTSHYYSHVYSMGSSEYEKIYTVGFVTPEFNLAPGASAHASSTFYIGPEVATQLNAVAPGLDLTIDYGWLWIISKAIFWVMDHINNVVGNWGWSIILVTIVIKLLFYKLSEASYRSMAKVREIQPRIAMLRERYGDDRQKLSQATMEMYKKEKINPMGGCLPTLVQIPVFIALYYVLF